MKEYRAGIYLRLSKEHEEKNNSIEAQREITTRFKTKTWWNDVRYIKRIYKYGNSKRYK